MSKSHAYRWYGVLSFCALLSASALAAPAKSADEPLGERRVEGADAKMLIDAMIGAGAKKEPAPVDDVPVDHPRMKIGKDFVYRMEAITCHSDKKVPKCEALALSKEKAKTMVAFLKKLGVKETKPPKGAGKGAKPFYYLKEIICGAAEGEGVENACLLTAHFHPKKN